MEGLLRGLVELIVYILPAMIANGAPVIMNGPPPIDFGRRLRDGRRLFGDGKTWGGLLGGLTAGTLTGAVEAAFVGAQVIPYSALSSIGALTGDLFGSFIKRRLGLERGAQAPLLDQLGFYIFALLYLYAVGKSFPLVDEIAWAAVIYCLHRLTNWGAYKLSLKRVPW
ncbi:MAG: CDP-2,3-bis-(O-geranylgeranyl)-sn-glycerol synthase [Acidilobus sp.]